MALRTIPFGYQIIDGGTVVLDSEAVIVRKIFSLYNLGKTLKEIAEIIQSQNVVYNQGSSCWNKNMVSRIIENGKYIGNESFPQIISKEQFDEANCKKAEKGAKKSELHPVEEYIRSVLICEECGSHYRRINKWRSREKWLCSNGCKCSKYVDDKYLEGCVLEAINSAISYPNFFANDNNTSFEPDNAVVRCTNEIYRMIEQPKINYALTESKILECAELKFSCCRYDGNADLTDSMVDELREIGEQIDLCIEILKRYVRHISVCHDGTVKVQFINNEIITTGGKDNAGYDNETSYKDRSQSASDESEKHTAIEASCCLLPCVNR